MSDAKVSVRDVEIGDVSAIAVMVEEIERYYGTTDIDPLDVRIAQTREALFGSRPIAYGIVAVDENDTLVGMAAYSFTWPAYSATHTLFLKELYVTEGHRRQGVATQLMEHVKDLARTRPGCSRVEWTADRDNPEALDFYEALGYSVHEGKAYFRWAVE
jgi:GNAT superfamily N-acetyltransferase